MSDDDLPPLSPNPRGQRQIAEDEHLSDVSMPSLQTVSDSSSPEEASESSSDEEVQHNPPTNPTVNAPGPPPRLPRQFLAPPSQSVSSEESMRTLEMFLDTVMQQSDIARSRAPFFVNPGRGVRGTPGGWNLSPPSLRDSDAFTLAAILDAIPHGSHSQIVDPQRAETIIAQLEVVPQELIQRYEKLRKGNEDDFDGCAICRDSLVSSPEEVLGESSPSIQDPSALPDSKLDLHSRIVAFPCPGTHLFHDTCISPWLSRKTTCPTCRFDVDPDSLTLSPEFMPPRTPSRRPRKPWRAPKVKPFARWLTDEENKARGLPVEPYLELSTADDEVEEDIDADDENSDIEDDDDDDAWTTDDDDESDELARNATANEATRELLRSRFENQFMRNFMGDDLEPRLPAGVSTHSDDDLPPLTGDAPERHEDPIPHPIEVDESSDEDMPPLEHVPPFGQTRPQSAGPSSDDDDDVPALIGDDVMPPLQPAPVDDSPPYDHPLGARLIDALSAAIFGGLRGDATESESENDDDDDDDDYDDLPPLIGEPRNPRSAPRPSSQPQPTLSRGPGRDGTTSNRLGSRGRRQSSLD